MRRPKYPPKKTVNTVKPHDLWKFFEIILTYPELGEGGDFIWCV